MADRNMCFLSLHFQAKFCLKAVLLLANNNSYKPVVVENLGGCTHTHTEITTLTWFKCAESDLPLEDLSATPYVYLRTLILDDNVIRNGMQVVHPE